MTNKLYTIKVTHLDETEFRFLVNVVKHLGHKDTLYVQENNV